MERLLAVVQGLFWPAFMVYEVFKALRAAAEDRVPHQTGLTLLPLLRRSGHGRIVNASSEAGSLATMDGGTPAYTVSKAALNALTRLWPASRAAIGSWSMPSAPAGSPPTWAAPVDGRWPRARPASWAVDLPDDGPTGGFYRDGRPIPW